MTWKNFTIRTLIIFVLITFCCIISFSLVWRFGFYESRIVKKMNDKILASINQDDYEMLKSLLSHSYYEAFTGTIEEKNIQEFIKSNQCTEVITTEITDYSNLLIDQSDDNTWVEYSGSIYCEDERYNIDVSVDDSGKVTHINFF